MARKRPPETTLLPSSPVAAKLLNEVTKPSSESPPPAPPQETEAHNSKPQTQKKKRSKVEKTHEARVMLTQDERKALTEVVGKLQDISGTEVTRSHVLRALLTLTFRATSSISANSEHARVPARPANNDWRKSAEYEDAIADYLLIALRDRRHMDTED